MAALRSPGAVVCVVAAFVLAGCGNKHAVVTEAHTEGPYVMAGGLKYQVQISRQLNARDVEDRTYIQGIAPAERSLSPDQTWFAVFVRVVNDGARRRPAAEEFEIEDTQGRHFEPVEVSRDNVFAYRPTSVAPGATIPLSGSVADLGPTSGSMLLFKLTYESLGNRPLELRILGESAPREAVISLDV